MTSLRNAPIRMMAATLILLLAFSIIAPAQHQEEKGKGSQPHPAAGKNVPAQPKVMKAPPPGAKTPASPTVKAQPQLAAPRMRTQPPTQVRTAPPPPKTKTYTPPPAKAQMHATPPGQLPAAQGKTNQIPGATVPRTLAGRGHEVRTPSGAIITRHPEGFRRVEVQHPGGRTVVAEAGGHRGFVQRPLAFRNQQFVQRTYFYHGHTYAQVYRPYHYGGFVFDVYTPYRYYRPGFYAWAYQPWRTGFYFSWGWMGNPWYAYYNWYFTPYAVYPSPAFWLTDYLLAVTFEDAYQARMDAALSVQPYVGEAALTPAVKQAIADEVRRELDQERAAAEQTMASGQPAYGAAPPIFAANGPSVFIVSNPLEVYAAGGGECALTEGDVLRLSRRPVPNSAYAETIVLASKGQDCACGSIVSVGVQDLQEMDNQLRARIDQGLGELQSHQGQGGLPALPPAATGPVVNAPFSSAVRPDSDAAAQIGAAAQEANQTEPLQTPSSPAVIGLGQTTDQVVAILGQPLMVVNLGEKQIYVYKNMKITFLNGKVTDVQ